MIDRETATRRLKRRYAQQCELYPAMFARGNGTEAQYIQRNVDRVMKNNLLREYDPPFFYHRIVMTTDGANLVRVTPEGSNLLGSYESEDAAQNASRKVGCAAVEA